MIIGLILLGVILNTGAQLCLKAGMGQVGHFEFVLTNFIPITLKIIGNFPILTGLCLYVISVGIWLLVLSRVQVSVAYPMLSIGYIVNAIAAHYFFGEPLSLIRMLGMLIIITGVYLIAQSHS